MKLCFFVVAALLSSATDSRLESSARMTTSVVQLAEVGDFHGSDVPLRHGGADWIGLFPEGESYVWRGAVLNFRYVRDEMVDEAGNAFTGKRLSVKDPVPPLFLIRGMPAWSGLHVVTVWRKSEANAGGLPGGDVETFDLHGLHYRLEVRNPNPGEGGELGRGASLVLSGNGLTQVLYSLPEGGNDASWVLHWVGDLDGDGKLDLYVSASDHYNVDHRILFASSGARKHELVHALATFTTLGC